MIKTSDRRLALTILAGLFALTTAQAAPPNVVLLLSDDQGWKDYGFMGHPHLNTPHLDALASKGLLYERGYVTSPLCRPSLASIVAGQYPHQTELRGNDPVLPNGANRNSDRELWMQWSRRMEKITDDKPSFVKLLKENGYATLQTGKWWEGNPLERGFTHAMTHGDLSRGGRHGDEGLEIGRTTMQPIHDFIDEAAAQEQPFFIWYGVYLPHTPHNAPERLFNKYKDIAPDEPTAWYWANVEWLDETCGQLVADLKSRDLYENTLFVYTCDNGWVQDPTRKNASVRSKRQPVEDGIRTPIFLTFEGQIEPQRDTQSLASNLDIAPTILKACGIEVPAEMTGLDLREPEQLKARNQVYVDVYEHDTDIEKLADLSSGLKARVIIHDWDKLIATPNDNKLYNLKIDPDDKNNLAKKNPEKVAELTKKIEKVLP